MHKNAVLLTSRDRADTDMATRLHVLSQARADARGAVCLDGSPPAFWYQPPYDLQSGNASWLVHLDGGAWCYDERDCAARSRSEKGSSRPLKRRYWPYSGPLDGRPSVNPTFAGFHRVNLAYCDGGSWTGDRTEPLVGPGGERLFLRGRRVLDLLVEELLQLGMRHARHVLWVGGSAGGPGALHSADRVQRQLGPALESFKVLIISGFFVLRAEEASLASAAAGGSCGTRPKALAQCTPWAAKMRYMVNMHNGTAAMSRACTGAPPGPAGRPKEEEAWRCFFPEHAAKHVAAPVYFINSALDSWQIVNVWRRFARCRWDGMRNCTADDVRRDVRATNEMSAALVRDVRAAIGGRDGNGAFVETCNEHIGGLDGVAFAGYEVGGVTMRDALAAWWRAPPGAPTAEHMRMPCVFAVPGSGGTAARRQHNQCNPSCKVSRRKRRLNQECPCDPP